MVKFQISAEKLRFFVEVGRGLSKREYMTVVDCENFLKYIIWNHIYYIIYYIINRTILYALLS